MLSCEDIAKLVSESLDHDLPWPKRLVVRFHFALCSCPVCRSYLKQVELFRGAIAAVSQAPLTWETGAGPALPEDQREAMKKSLNQARRGQG